MVATFPLFSSNMAAAWQLILMSCCQAVAQFTTYERQGINTAVCTTPTYCAVKADSVMCCGVRQQNPSLPLHDLFSGTDFFRCLWLRDLFIVTDRFWMPLNPLCSKRTLTSTPPTRPPPSITTTSPPPQLGAALLRRLAQPGEPPCFTIRTSTPRARMLTI